MFALEEKMARVTRERDEARAEHDLVRLAAINMGKQLTAAQAEVVELRLVLETAHAALRGVETGCDPLTVPLEPMREVRAALKALEPWMRP